LILDNLLQPHEGPSETRQLAHPRRPVGRLQPHEGPSETVRDVTLATAVAGFNLTRVRLKLSGRSSSIYECNRFNLTRVRLKLILTPNRL